jgi:hypothetical protein
MSLLQEVSAEGSWENETKMEIVTIQLTVIQVRQSTNSQQFVVLLRKPAEADHYQKT